MPNDKLLTVLRGLSPAALRAVIDELAKLGPPAGLRSDDGRVLMRRPLRRAR